VLIFYGIRINNRGFYETVFGKNTKRLRVNAYCEYMEN